MKDSKVPTMRWGRTAKRSEPLPEKPKKLLPNKGEFEMYFDVAEFTKWMFAGERWTGSVFTFSFNHPTLNAQKLAQQNPDKLGIIREWVPKFLKAVLTDKPKKDHA